MHSYLVLRKLLRTLQSVYSILQSSLWSNEGFIRQTSVLKGYLKRQDHVRHQINLKHFTDYKVCADSNFLKVTFSSDPIAFKDFLVIH